MQQHFLTQGLLLKKPQKHVGSLSFCSYKQKILQNLISVYLCLLFLLKNTAGELKYPYIPKLCKKAYVCTTNAKNNSASEKKPL